MFVDTKVFVAARFVNNPDHVVACRHLDRADNSEEPLLISRQIVREHLVVVTRQQNWAKPLPITDTLDDVTRLGFCPEGI